MNNAKSRETAQVFERSEKIDKPRRKTISKLDEMGTNAPEVSKSPKFSSRNSNTEEASQNESDALNRSSYSKGNTETVDKRQKSVPKSKYSSRSSKPNLEQDKKVKDFEKFQRVCFF